MQSRPVLFRLLLPFFVLAAVIAGVSLALTHWVAQGSVYLDQMRTLEAVVGVARQGGITVNAKLTPMGFDRFNTLAQSSAARITIIAGDGSVVFDTDSDAKAMENHNGRPEVIDARRQQIGTSTRESKTLQRRALYIAQLIDDAKPNGLVARVCYVNTQWASLQTPLWAVTAGGLATTVAMLLLLAVILKRQWVGPTRDLAAAAERMAAGHWNARVDPRGSEDVRFLANKMNGLASNAENQLAEIGKQRRDLRSLVDTLPDPILVTDAAGRVVLINAPAAELLQLAAAQVIGKKTVSVVNDEALLQMLDAANKVAPNEHTKNNSHDIPHVHREVRLLRGGQRLTYQSVATRTATGGALLVLRDVSTMANTLQMKTDFVANASHELRTPIAAIKIAMETLRDVHGEDPNQAERCITIIDGHVKRLEEMLRDLLDLSRLESPDAEPKLADVKPWDLFAVVRSTMGPTARQKGVELRFGDDPITPDSFDSDERLLHLVLKNLVENSIKFTPPGGSITVSIVAIESLDKPAVRLSVSDTGIGIPPEHRDRVFERFYQVDAARSGTAGRGTGLGLAIVKHAVAALSGTVKLESSVGRGTTVSCILPQHAGGLKELGHSLTGL